MYKKINIRLQFQYIKYIVNSIQNIQLSITKFMIILNKVIK